MRPIALIIIIFVISTAELSAQNFNSLIAYPVPYRVSRGPLTIGFGSPEAPVANLTVDCTIYDIYGDEVFSRSGGSVRVIWSGRNNSGRIVKPGLYIIKLKIEDHNDNNKTYKKLIRIVVDY